MHIKHTQNQVSGAICVFLGFWGLMIFLSVGGGILLSVIDIIMWVALFGSDKECGPSLYTFVILLMPFEILVCCCLPGIKVR